MPTVRVERTIPAAIERVFDVLTDHAGYKEFRICRDAELIREGEPTANGTGAMRRVLVGPVRFEEEITGYERPVRMEYVIRKINAPMEHQGGTMLFEPADGGTRVTWTSTFNVPLRGGGAIGGAATAPLIRLGFNSILTDVAKRLEGESA